MAPAGAVTLPETVAFALLLESVTTTPAAGAAPLSVTVHDDVPDAFTGVQPRLFMVTGPAAGAFTVTLAVRLCPFQLAVTVTD